MAEQTTGWKKTVLITASLALFLYFILISSDILIPFVAAMILAYMLDPVVNYMERWKIPRTAAIILLIFFSLSVLVLIGIIVFPLIRMQVEYLVENTPLYIERIKALASPFLDRITASHSQQVEQILEEGMKRFSAIPLQLIKAISSFLVNTVSNFINFIIMAIDVLIIPVALFYLLRDFEKIKKTVKDYLPPASKDEIIKTIKEIDTVLGAFIRGQLTVSLILALLYCVGLLIVGVPMGLLIGLVAGLANIVPYFGLVVGLLPSLLMAFLQFRDINHLIGVLLVFGVAQFLEGYFITPKVVGEKVGLHPVVIMIAVLVGAKFFGFIGILLAVPAAAVIKVFVTDALRRYKNSSLFRNAEK
jgi:predicted PurR-regulated permease PerM